MGFDVGDTKATFVDESFRKSNFWFIPIIVAQINFSQHLDWFYQLLFKLRQIYPPAEKLKANKAIELLYKLDIRTQNKIWNSLQDTIIVIVEPKEYIKKLGIEVLPNGAFKFRYERKEMLIERDDEAYSYLNTMLQKNLSKWILQDSPLLNINFSLSEISLLSPKENFFTIENFLSLINKKDDSRKEVMGTIKLVARMCSTFFDIIDPEEKRRTMEQLFQYESDFMWAVPEYHRELLRKSISTHRFFHEGHSPSVSIIKECFDNIATKLSYHTDDIIIPKGIVVELPFKDNIEMWAVDWASGIARNIYENEDIEGLTRKFKYIVLNGKIIEP